jgi:hypothetical protein
MLSEPIGGARLGIGGAQAPSPGSNRIGYIVLAGPEA